MLWHFFIHCIHSNVIIYDRLFLLSYTIKFMYNKNYLCFVLFRFNFEWVYHAIWKTYREQPNNYYSSANWLKSRLTLYSHLKSIYCWFDPINLIHLYLMPWHYLTIIIKNKVLFSDIAKLNSFRIYPCWKCKGLHCFN